MDLVRARVVAARVAAEPTPIYEVRHRDEVLSQHVDLLVALPASRRPGGGAELVRIADGVVLAKTHGGNPHLTDKERHARRARWELAQRRGTLASMPEE